MTDWTVVETERGKPEHPVNPAGNPRLFVLLLGDEMWQELDPCQPNKLPDADRWGIPTSFARVATDAVRLWPTPDAAYYVGEWLPS